MKLAIPLLEHVLELRDDRVSSLVIENGRLFRDIVEGLYACVEGQDDEFVLSDGGVDVKMPERVEMVSVLVPFTLNTKRLLGGLVKRLEKYALAPGVREQWEEILGNVEKFVHHLTLEFPHEITCEGLTAATLLKGCSPTFEEEGLSLQERLLGYMRLVRELFGERLYVLIGTRSYFTSEEMKDLLQLGLMEHFRILLVDSVEREMFPFEDRLLVDCDLCEITRADDSLV